MPLTVRMNGNTSANLVTSQWWNDYYNLLTGAMNDQPVTLAFLPATAQTTPVLLVQGNGNAPYFEVQGSGATNLLTIDVSGNLNVYGVANFKNNVGIGSGYTLNASGGIIGDGKFGAVAAGDLLDGSGYDTFVKARGASNIVHLQVNNADVASFAANGMTLPSSAAYIAVGSFLGIKTTGGTKLAEIKNNGTLVINGSTYYTTQASASFGTGASFDGFDLGECYETDQNYALGTVVCPNASNVLARCPHDGCHAAMIITTTPGFCIGVPDPANNTLPVALSGRVLATTSVSVPAGSLVCSDGKGGIRPLVSGETNFAIGFTLQSDSNGQVGVFIRPMYAKAAQ